MAAETDTRAAFRRPLNPPRTFTPLDLELRVDYRALLIALLHKTQVRIIEQMIAVDTPWTPKGLAGALDEPLGNVSHHVRQLVAAGILVLDHEEPRRGAVAHFYRIAGRFTR
jgi:DNA-binding transcriptional ArsR family regulator